MDETTFDSLRTRTLALGRALNRSDEFLEKTIQNQGLERTYEMLLCYRRSECITYGMWKRDYIDLRSYVERVDICKSNPKEEKKAYEALQAFLVAKKLTSDDPAGMTNWEYKVVDPAFGELRLFEGGETDA